MTQDQKHYLFKLAMEVAEGKRDFADTKEMILDEMDETAWQYFMSQYIQL